MSTKDRTQNKSTAQPHSPSSPIAAASSWLFASLLQFFFFFFFCFFPGEFSTRVSIVKREKAIRGRKLFCLFKTAIARVILFAWHCKYVGLFLI